MVLLVTASIVHFEDTQFNKSFSYIELLGAVSFFLHLHRLYFICDLRKHYKALHRKWSTMRKNLVVLSLIQTVNNACLNVTSESLN